MPVRYSEDSSGPSTRRSYASSGNDSGYPEWTKDELSAELEGRGLPKTGSKAELIARLQEADAVPNSP